MILSTLILTAVTCTLPLSYPVTRPLACSLVRKRDDTGKTLADGEAKRSGRPGLFCFIPYSLAHECIKCSCSYASSDKAFRE
ncbi:hypothetical protein EI94DRAFT_1733017 [Lactarius quietus]|nr:hypothetical protein EI94DRAFT_1733017 [Lactarius quietus]